MRLPVARPTGPARFLRFFLDARLQVPFNRCVQYVGIVTMFQSSAVVTDSAPHRCPRSQLQVAAQLQRDPGSLKSDQNATKVCLLLAHIESAVFQARFDSTCVHTQCSTRAFLLVDTRDRSDHKPDWSRPTVSKVSSPRASVSGIQTLDRLETCFCRRVPFYL